MRRRAYMAMTMPGVQKPHCAPCDLARRSCTGCIAPEWPMPSTVMTWQPSTAIRGVMQELTDLLLAGQLHD